MDPPETTKTASGQIRTCRIQGSTDGIVHLLLQRDKDDPTFLPDFVEVPDFASNSRLYVQELTKT